MNNFSQSSTRYSAAITPKAAKVIARHINSSRRLPRRSGFTVLEVLIALVVLLIGGLAIMNLFPPALNVIRGSENREVAMSQVKGTLARLNAEPASIPEAIYNYDPAAVNAATNPYGYSNVDSAVVGTRNRNNSLPKMPTDTNSALDQFKRIIGEKHNVLRTNGATPDYFVMANYPISTEVDGAGVPLLPRVYIADNVDGALVDANGKIDFKDAKIARTGASVYDPTTGNLLPQWSNDCIYYVSYRWRNNPPAAGERFQGVIDEPFTPTSFGNRVFWGRALLPLSKFVVPGAVALKVYKEYTSSLPPLNSVELNSGLLLLNTAGYGVPVSEGQEVSINYTVRDWRWIVNDAAPASTSIVRVPFNTLDGNQSIYSVVSAAPNASFNVGSYNAYSWTTPAELARVDFRRGEIDYSKAPAIILPIAARSRTVYQTEGKWAQQLSVAAQSYYAYNAEREIPSLAASENERERWREYSWSSTSNSDTIYFRPSEAGKTVMVTFGVGATETIQDQIVTINERLKSVSVATTPLPGSPLNVAEARLSDKNGNLIAATSILSVRGVSVRARAAWVQNGNYTQEIAEMYRPLN